MAPFSISSFSLLFFLLVNLWASVLQIYCLLKMNQPYSWQVLPALCLQKYWRPLGRSVRGFQSRADSEFLVCTTFAQTVHKQAAKYSVDGEVSERSGHKEYHIYSLYFIINTGIENNMFTFFCVCMCVFPPFGILVRGKTNKKTKTQNCSCEERFPPFLLFLTYLHCLSVKIFECWLLCLA